jgi:hypothetical protein
MTRILLSVSIFLSATAMSRAQSKDDFKVDFERNGDVSALRITDMGGEIPVHWADTKEKVLKNITLYRIANPDTPTVHADPISCAFYDVDLSDVYVSLSLAAPTSCPKISTGTFPLAEGSYFLEIKASALQYAGRQNPQPTLKDVCAPFPVTKEVAAKVNTAANVAKLYEQVRVTQDAPVSTAGLAGVNVQRVTLRLTPDNDIIESKKDIPASYIADKDAKANELKQTLDFELGTRLSDGQQYLLRGPEQLVDAWGRPVKAEGKLKLPDVPKTDDDAKITGTLSAQAAVHQKAVFQLTGKFSPLSRDYLGGGRDHPGYPNYPNYWDPSLAVDIGLRSTKSANSIIATGLLRHWIDDDNCAGTAKSDAVLVAYQKWVTSSPVCLSDVRFAIGPRLETDRDFMRLNTLGEARFDFDFYRWHGSMSDRRKLILADLKGCRTEKRNCKQLTGESDFLEGPDFGFSFVPYLELDGGGHVNTETVKNTKPAATEIVPRHGIFRMYAGGVAEFDYRRITVKLDAAIIEMALPETIGFVTTTGVGLRNVSGIQPHSKASFDYSFDPAKHYSWNVAYENGRSAPNFEYLNKFTSGIKVIY